MPNQRATLVYDHQCSLCRDFVGWLKKWDRANELDARPLQDDNVYQEFPSLNREACEKAIHLVTTDGRVFSGVSIVEPLMERFPRIKRIAWMIGLPRAKPLAERLYNWVARHREKWNKEKS